MKISKFNAADMRQALRAVREQLGADAVILSSRRVPTGIEVTAAIDYEAESAQAAALAAQESAFSPQEFSQVAAAVSEAASAKISDDSLSDEIKTLRRILETQVAQLAWNDLSRRAPIHTEVLRELTQFGLSREFASQIVATLPPRMDLTQARRLAIATVAQAVPVTGDRWLDDGGCLALVGPTGVGKTTTLAKLAVRWTLRHGARELAIVSTDSMRIGAHEPMRSLGQMLGAATHTIDSLTELPELLSRLGKYRLVLIDTAGTSQRDTQLAGRLADLRAAGERLETALVLAASTQAGAIEETIVRFAAAKPACCLLTKVDEAASLGGVISIVTQARLPIAYLSEGQSVPEDLRPARALELVTCAVQLAQTNGATADEDLLRRRFGDVAHGLA